MFFKLPHEQPYVKTFGCNPMACMEHWGRLEVINSLTQVAVTWYEMTEGKPLQVGHISRQDGNNFPPHLGHRKGLEVDLRPIKQKLSLGAIDWRGKDYSRDFTKKLIVLLRMSGTIDKIFFNDPHLVAQGLCQYLNGHDKHLHVRYRLSNPLPSIKKE